MRSSLTVGKSTCLGRHWIALLLSTSSDYHYKKSKAKLGMMLKWLNVQFFLGWQSAKNVFPLSNVSGLDNTVTPIDTRAHTCMHLFAFVQHIWVPCLIYSAMTPVCTRKIKRCNYFCLLVLLTIWQWPCWVHNIQWRRIPQVLLLGSTLIFCLIVRMKSFVTVVQHCHSTNQMNCQSHLPENSKNSTVISEFFSHVRVWLEL